MTGDKKAIKQLRESAMGMTVGDGSEGAIAGMMQISDRLYIIKEKAIYIIALADDIDPDRTRIDIPNTQQLVVKAGAESAIVRRILLTARELFKKDYLVDHVDSNAALTVCLELLKSLIAAREIADEYLALKSVAEATVSQPKNRAFRLPAIPGIEARAKSFIQKADHATQDIYKLCTVFYPEAEMRKAGGWLDGFKAIVKARYDAQDQFVQFAEMLAELGKIARNTRHCVEHEKETQRIDLRDYHLTADRILEGPSIQVIHSVTPQGRMPLGEFMEAVLDQLITGSELLMAYLAARHHIPLGGFQSWVGEVPEDQRGSDGVKFGYLIEIAGRAQKLG